MVFIFTFNLITVFPITANAGILSAVSSFFSSGAQDITSAPVENNSQNVPLLTSTTNFDSNAAVGGGDISVTDDNEALISESGPSGTLADIESDTVTTGQISKYIVRNGDTLELVAKMYGVTKNTIIWANNLTSTKLKEGQSLIILPVSGTLHTVVKGDTLKTIAKKYKGDFAEIAQFNDISLESNLAIGDTIIIPDGEGSVKVSGTSKKVATKKKAWGSGPEYSGYYVRPVVGGHKTQGLHGYNSVDIGIPVGSTLYAAAGGQIILARPSGYNGGYGKYVIISHDNGTQTVYGHMSKVFVTEGQIVERGEIIGLTGNTGRSTGPHLHFEIRGAYNIMNDSSQY